MPRQSNQLYRQGDGVFVANLFSAPFSYLNSVTLNLF